MEKRKINGKEMVNLIRDKTGYHDLLMKYSLTQKQLDMLLQKLVDAGMLIVEELPVKPQVTLPSATKECPRCGELMNDQDDKCPHCGVVISELMTIGQFQKECPKCHHIYEYDVHDYCPKCAQMTTGYYHNWEASRPQEKNCAQVTTHKWEASKPQEKDCVQACQGVQTTPVVANEQERREREWKDQIAAWIDHGLPVVNSPVLLKKGESAHYTSPVEVFQQKTKRRTYRTYAGSRVKIFKMPLYFGGSSSHTYAEEVIESVGVGNFVITTKRIVLMGTKISYSIKVDKINGMQLYSDALQIFNDGARAGRFYSVNDPLRAALILNALMNML